MKNDNNDQFVGIYDFSPIYFYFFISCLGVIGKDHSNRGLPKPGPGLETIIFYNERHSCGIMKLHFLHRSIMTLPNHFKACIKKGIFVISGNWPTLA